jgi:tRNA-binding EMAP/Myf-like protein
LKSAFKFVFLQYKKKQVMENQNSVCFVAKINEIKPIEGADNIEQVVVGGWNCISQKNTYKINDFVIVATTDAVIPIELSDSLNVTNYLRKGQRVRTVKLRGVYSECLLIPMKFNKQPIGDNYSDGKDMMEIMGITKYEPPIKQKQLASGKKIRYQYNPNFHVYYKFPNVKNVPGMFDENDMVEISRKIHGTNARYGIVKKKKLSIIDKVKKFTWDHEKISTLLGPVRHRQGRLIGRMEAIGFSLREEAMLQTLTMDILKSSEIEGVILDPKQVRSSVARRLGMDIAGLGPSDRHVDGVVEMMLDATQGFKKPLTKKRLLGWHAALFPTGHSGLHKIGVGAWRDDHARSSGHVSTAPA